MSPQSNRSPKTTGAGIVSIISGALLLFLQIWGGIHGQSVDPTSAAGGIGMVGAGIGLVSAKDNK